MTAISSIMLADTVDIDYSEIKMYVGNYEFWYK